MKLLCMILLWSVQEYVITNLFKPTEQTIARMTLKVNNRLWVMMMCQCWFHQLSQRYHLVSDVENGGGYACVGEGSIWEITVNLKLLYKMAS